MTESDEWKVLYNGGNAAQETKRHKTESGQSPGVKFKLPLHKVHEVELGAASDSPPLKLFRVFIVKPKAGWGVSLWQLKVYGVKA
jgi:hypothetical protein